MSAGAPQPPPVMSPDGRYRWDGDRWVETRPAVPWQYRAAQGLVFVEAAAVLCFGMLIMVAVGAIGLLANADNGGAGLPVVGRSLVVIFVATLMFVAFLISIGIAMARRRWARWTVIGVEALLLAYVVYATVYYLVAQPGSSFGADMFLGIVIAAVPVLAAMLSSWPDAAARYRSKAHGA